MGLAITPYLRAVLANAASDLHLKPGSPPRVRVSGSLVALREEPLSSDEVAQMVLPTMSQDLAEIFEKANEVDYAVAVARVGRFRVNVYRTRGDIAAVLRHITDQPLTLAELGMPEALAKMALQPRGLILVTGPTGSGKTTTLAAMVDEINRNRAVHIVTIEDPIEVSHTDKLAAISQREIGADTRNFSTALRTAMRQDPDVMLIGEMRDTETVRAALAAAETGHLVMSTLHTTDAKETVHRVVDFFADHEQRQVRLSLAASLKGIVCQRLVPRADGAGRIAVMEVAVADPRVAEAVADPEKTDTIPDLVAAGSYLGMRSFDQDLCRLVLEGTVTLEDARLVATRPHDLSVMLRRAGMSAAQAEVVAR
ncbi:MAG TPA: PilT/PilU family type 4a pilus ATPase [Sporichthyaceae bacterium]|jgi:twitching motility protein PilT|nr:PilT/PilU family type 4a pilus ATPase [Sporichthyaceae bacterium]